MTREQAINYLYSSGFSEGQVKAVVEALTDEDAISREEVHDLLVTWLNDYLTDETRDALEVIDAKIEDLPSVTPSINVDAIHREREQAYLRGYEDASKKYRQEPCNDAISREDALKLLYDFKEKHTEDREQHPINYGTLLDLIRLIRELPSVTPSVTNDIEKSNFDKRQYRIDTDTAYQCGYEQGKKDSRRKGHWIDKTEWYECSECGETHSYCHKFCPYCGVKMVEPQESEDNECQN